MLTALEILYIWQWPAAICYPSPKVVTGKSVFDHQFEQSSYRRPFSLINFLLLLAAQQIIAPRLGIQALKFRIVPGNFT